METTAGQINVEEFKSWLTRQKTTKELFRWSCSTEEAFNLLQAAYSAEVAQRGAVCDMIKEVNDNLWSTAVAMTNKSTKCGILLCGNCGNGKTTTMNAFVTVSKYLDALSRRNRGSINPLNIQQTSARRLTQVAKDENCMNEAKRAQVLCIDDMGLEPTEVLDFGNAINPVIEILEHRYRQQLFTFITTNLTPKQIREKYGDRIADRFNEMMKCIVYTNPTFRK
jgi:DNA replication protein DnaC